MALFRYLRGGLAESLKTTRIVEDLDRLSDLLECSSGDLEISAYPDSTNNFDARIGWFTHIVMKKENDDKFYPIGFLSEDIK